MRRRSHRLRPARNAESLAHSGPWTLETLRLIAAREGTAAAELAVELGLDKMVLKRKVRRLKASGLTESLPSGYRLSPRVRTALALISEPRHRG